MTNKNSPPNKTSHLSKIPINIFCDGACFANGSSRALASWAFYGQIDDGNVSMSGLVSGDQTNNRGELSAIRSALVWCLENKFYCVRVFTDSEYAKNVTVGGWKRNVNNDLLNDIDILIDKMCCVTVQWVKGHSDVQGNIIADKLASDELSKKLGPKYSRYDQGRQFSSKRLSSRKSNVGRRFGRRGIENYLGKQ